MCTCMQADTFNGLKMGGGNCAASWCSDILPGGKLAKLQADFLWQQKYKPFASFSKIDQSRYHCSEAHA